MSGANLAVTSKERNIAVLIDDKLDFTFYNKGTVNRAKEVKKLIITVMIIYFS